MTERIAAGGMAEVWAARDQVLERPVAVKLLGAHLSADPVARRRFQREARAAAGLSSHPNVVTIYDVGEVDERSFMVMELRAGGTLADTVRAGRPVPAETVLGWLRDTASALDAAHERGIVHRDIKPANLLLDEHGHVAIADFGIARVARDSQMTATGQVLGTAGYLSPEQAYGEPATPASDRYALAVVAYELLTGTKVFPGAEHVAAQVRAHAEDAPAAPSARNRRLPAAVDDVLLRGLAKDPARRWPTATTLVEALAGALEGSTRRAPAAVTAPTRAIGATPVAAVKRQSGAPTRRTADEYSWSMPRRRRRVLPVVGLVVAIVALVVVVLMAGSPDRPAPSATNSRPAPPPAPAPVAQPAPPPPAPAQPSGTPAQLNGRGFALFQQGRYAAAVPLLRAAVNGCGDSRNMDPCGYALYNLGASLHRSGHSREAVVILVRRLRRFGDNEQHDVRRELVAALKSAALGG